MSKCTVCGVNFVGVPELPLPDGVCVRCDNKRLQAEVEQLRGQRVPQYDSELREAAALVARLQRQIEGQADQMGLIEDALGEDLCVQEAVSAI